MIFHEGHRGSKDRLGGLPSHLPSEFPISPVTGDELPFLAQFYCESPHLPFPDILCLQLYQSQREDEETIPTLVVVGHGAPPNENQKGTGLDSIAPYDVSWEYREDPDEPEFGSDVVKSKSMGVDYFCVLDADETLVLQLTEQPGGFSFGSYVLQIFARSDGQLDCTLS